MKRCLVISISLLLLAACAPTPTATPLPTATATATTAITTTAPTSTPTLTPTPRLQATLKQDAVLYSGPGNEEYDALAQLKAGVTVYPLGMYIDFLKVEMENSGKTIQGFISKDSLGIVPQGLKELAAMEVPWQPVFIKNNFVGIQTAFQGNDIILKNERVSAWDVAGSEISVDSPVMLTLKLQVEGASFGSVKVYGIFDQPNKLWWQDIRRMDIQLNGGSLQLCLRDGTSAACRATINLPVNASQTFSLVFKDTQGKELILLDKDQHEVKTVDVTSIPGLQMKDGLLPQRKLYLGASSASHSTLTISAIILRQAPTGKWAVTAEKKTGLRELANQSGITIGTHWSLYQMANKQYWNIMTNDYTTVIVSDFSDRNFWRGRGDYDFQTVDKKVDFAIQQGWRVRASHLVWGTSASGDTYDAIPEWLRRGSFSRDEYVQILEEHVKTVVNHFKGRVTEWNIANEASSRSFGDGDFWRQKIGPDYIEESFRWAKQADPNGILIFNDDDNESPRDARSQRVIQQMYGTVKNLKAKGVPIDVVGMQMHLLYPWNSQIPPMKEDVIKTMRMFGDLGVGVFITEFDVHLQNIKGTQQERLEFQAKLYRDMLEACLESNVCKSFSTWGVYDGEPRLVCTVRPGFCVNEDPLMFDADFRPKPAYFAVRNALAGK